MTSVRINHGIRNVNLVSCTGNTAEKNNVSFYAKYLIIGYYKYNPSMYANRWQGNSECIACTA